jgi:DNA-binding MarR family transcriptional regulator
MRRRQLEARLARELSSGAGLSMQDYDVLSALTGVGDQRWRGQDLATHLLWSPSLVPSRRPDAAAGTN